MTLAWRITLAAASLALAGSVALAREPVGASAASADPDLLALLPPVQAPAPGAPRASDVLFSPRFDRPQALAVARAFGATRMVWSYIEPGAILDGLRDAVGGRFGGTLNNNLPTPGDRGLARDFDGNPIIAPWMASWGARYNTCAAPETMQVLRERIDRLVAAGVRDLQFDDAGMQFNAAFWNVGDLSPASLAGFAAWTRARREAGEDTPLSPEDAGRYRDWLAERHGVTDTADYVRRSGQFPSTPFWRRHLRETVQGCLDAVRSHLRDVGGPQASLSINLYTPYPWSNTVFFVDHADHLVGEVDPAQSDLARIALFSQWLALRGRHWSPVFPLTEVATLRRLIALAYAYGATPVVPWDVFIPPQGGAAPVRYFGRPEDFGDHFRFVRAHAGWFDGWGVLARVDLLIDAGLRDRGGAIRQLQRLAQAGVPVRPWVQSGVLMPMPWPAPGPGREQWSLASPAPAGAGAAGAASVAPPAVQLLPDAILAGQASVRQLSAGWHAVIKGHPQRPGERVVHLVRTEPAGGGAPGSDRVRVTLAPWVLPPGRTVEAAWVGGISASEPPPAVTADADGAVTIDLQARSDWLLLHLRTPAARAPRRVAGSGQRRPAAGRRRLSAKVPAVRRASDRVARRA